MAQSTLPAAPGCGFPGINPAQCTGDAEPAECDFEGDPAPIRLTIKLFGNHYTLSCDCPAGRGGGSGGGEGWKRVSPGVPERSLSPLLSRRPL